MKKAIENALKTACAMCHKPLTEDLLIVWEIGLDNYTEEHIKKATVEYCKNADTTIMPTPFIFAQYGNSKEFDYL